MLFFLFLFQSCMSYIFVKQHVVFTASEKNAKIYVDGIEAGIGSTDIIAFKRNQCKHVKIEKIGFLTANFRYCSQLSFFPSFKHKTKYIELMPDDAYDASIMNDYANKDFEQEVCPTISEENAWKIISQIVTSYFDNLEMSDRSTGYMKTSWQSKSFSQKTVRTRVIVKQSNIEPLRYKIKIISEYSDNPNQSVKDDDKFKEWDRILNKYSELISEFQFRLAAK